MASRPELAPSEWRTKDGRVLDVKDMDNDHLVNLIRYLERTSSIRQAAKIALFRAEARDRWLEVD